VGADREAAALLQALGETPAARLKELLGDYEERFDRIFPALEPAPADRSEPRRRWPGFQFMP
jgi:hypothetical protein